MKKLLLIIICSISVLAQSIITNENVAEMVKSGLSAEIIKAKIKSSETKFDTSTEALKKLSEQGIPESVVVAMIEREESQKQITSQEKKETSKIFDSVPEQGKLSDIADKTKVYIYTDELKARDIIAKHLTKDKRIAVVDKIEDSDFAIRYHTELSPRGNGYELVGYFSVIMPSEDGNRIRQIYSVIKSKFFAWDDNPAESTTKQFIKDLSKAK